MKTLITIICIFITCNLLAQNTWFKFVPGGYGRNSAIQNDTIFTFCPTAQLIDGLVTQGFTVNKIGFKNGNVLNSDSFFYFLNTLNQYTNLEYRREYNIIYNPTQNNFLIALNYADSTKYGIKLQSNLFSYPDFKPQNIPLNYDTFDTKIEGLFNIHNKNYALTTFLNINNDITTFSSPRLLRIHSQDSTQLIWTHLNYNPLGTFISLNEIKEDKKDKANIFLNLRYNWDFHGGPACWDGVIKKIDTTGKLIWECRPGGDQDSVNLDGFSFLQIPNGNLLCSWIDSYYRPWKDPKYPYQNENLKMNATLWFAEIDYTTGKKLWLKNNRQFLDWKMGIKDTDYANLQIRNFKIIEDGVLWCGYRTIYKLNRQNYYTSIPFLFKVDFQGNPIWYREHDLFANDTTDKGFEPYSFIQTPDKGFLLTGVYRSQWIKSQQEFNFFQTAALLKLDSNGCLQPGCNAKDNIVKVTAPTSLCTIYPNPANNKLNIVFEGNVPQNLIANIYDSKGSLIKSETLINNEIDINNLAQGLYLLTIESEGKSYSSKFVKE
ncbi:MAG: T9SS type A sorting domain-containing protein [Bacteroidota bacterium]